jgi:hypothetical protein
MAQIEAQRPEVPSLSELKQKFGGIIWGEVHTCYSKLPKGARTIYSKEDIFSEALLVICEKFNKFDPERGGATTFITTIVRNKLSNLCRAQYTQDQGEGDIVLSMEGSGEDDGSFEVMQSKMTTAKIDETNIFLWDISKGDPVVENIARGLMEGESYWRLKKESGLPVLNFNQKMDSLQSSVANLFGIVYNELTYDLDHGSIENQTQNTEDENEMVTVPKKVIPQKKVVPVKKVTTQVDEEASDALETKAVKNAPKATVPVKKTVAKKAPVKATGEKAPRSTTKKDGDMMKHLTPEALAITEDILNYVDEKVPGSTVTNYHDRVCFEIPGKSKGSNKRIGCILKSKTATAVTLHIRYIDTKDEPQGPNHAELKAKGLVFVRGAHSDYAEIATKKDIMNAKAAIKLRVASVTPATE